METSNNAIINQSRYEIHTVNLTLVIYVLAHIIISKKFSKRNVVCKIRTKEKRKLTKRKYSNESIQIFKDKVYMMLKFNRSHNSSLVISLIMSNMLKLNRIFHFQVVLES
jgi:hypothetical protein